LFGADNGEAFFSIQQVFNCHLLSLSLLKEKKTNTNQLSIINAAEVDDPREIHVSESNANEAKSFSSACYAAVPRKI
jgi:hypothetical protein